MLLGFLFPTTAVKSYGGIVPGSLFFLGSFDLRFFLGAVVLVVKSCMVQRVLQWELDCCVYRQERKGEGYIQVS